MPGASSTNAPSVRVEEADGSPAATCQKIVFPNGAVSITGGVATVSFASETALISRVPAFGTALGVAVGAGSNIFVPFVGDSAGDLTTETTVEMVFPKAVSVLEAILDVSVNAATGAGVVVLRKNGADTALTAAIGAGVTGQIALAGGPVSFAAGDRGCLKITTGTGGNTTHRGAMVVFS